MPIPVSEAPTYLVVALFAIKVVPAVCRSIVAVILGKAAIEAAGPNRIDTALAAVGEVLKAAFRWRR